MLASKSQEKWKWHIGGNGFITMPQCKGVLSTDCETELLRELHLLNIFKIFKSNDCFFD